MTAEIPDLSDFPVLWGDMDAYQHVNNVMYFRYLESSRVAYADQLNLYQVQQTTGIGPILAATSCRFIRPLRYPDTIRVGCRTVHLTETEIHQEQIIYSNRKGKLAASGTAIVVAYDYHQQHRSAFPQPILERILTLEKGLQLSSA